MEETRIDVKSCGKQEASHPCDPPKHCDPLEEPEGECSPPAICVEKLKNPAYPGEITTCLPGNHINVQTCDKAQKKHRHPCDPLPPCSTVTTKKRRPCNEPALCLQRIKNPDKKKKIKEPCDPEK